MPGPPLNLEELADGQQASHNADSKAGQRIGDGHKLNDLRERNDLEQSERIDDRDLRLKEVVQPPFEEECDDCAQHAKNKALDHERQADKAVGRAYHLHNGNLLAARVHGQLDGIGDDEQRHHKQHDNDDHGRDVQYLLERLKAVCDLVMRADLRHAVDLLDLGDRLLEQALSSTVTS